MAGNALSLGSLWIELGLRTEAFHEALDEAKLSLQSPFQVITSVLREAGQAIRTGAGKALADDFDFLITERLAPPLADFAADLDTLIPQAAKRVAADLGAPGGPVMTVRTMFGTDLPTDVRVTASALQDLRNDVRDVEQATLDVQTAMEATPPQPSLFDGLRNQAQSFVGFLASNEGLAGTAHRVFAFDLPDAVGEGFGSVLALQDSFARGWTNFTNALKHAWADALGSMVAAFVSGFTEPIGRQLGELMSKASGLMGVSVGSSATQVAGAAASGAANGAASGTSGASTTARNVGTVIGYAVGAEALGQTLRAAGFANVPTLSGLASASLRAFTNGGSELTFTGIHVSNALVPDAAWVATQPGAFQNTRDALFHDTLHWELARLKSQAAIKTLHPVSRTGGHLRGVYVTQVESRHSVVMPTDIGLELLLNGGLAYSQLGVDARWTRVGQGKMIAYFTDEGGLGFSDVESTQNTASAAPAASPSAGSSASGAGLSGAMSYPSLASAAQNFAQAVAVNLAEVDRDAQGMGVLTPTSQMNLSYGLSKVSHYLANKAAAAGVSLASIPIPGAGITFGELFPSFSGGSFATDAGARIQVNVDKFFGSDAELRQLTDEIVRIARQEGLILGPIV